MANGSRHSMRYVAETQYGVTPAKPVFTPIRHTSTTLGLSKETLQSEEIRDDRQISDFRHGAYQVGGDINFEISFGSFDDLLEAVLMGEWSGKSANSAQGIMLTVNRANRTFTRATGSFVTDGFQVGQKIVMSNWAGDYAGLNGLYTIETVSATVLKVAEPTATGTVPTLVDVASPQAGIKIIGYEGSLKAGVIRRSFTVERFFGDLAPSAKPFHRFTGVEMNSMSLAIAANAMLTGTFSVVGSGMETGQTAITQSTIRKASTTSPLDSFTGGLKEAGNTIAVITEIQLNLENGLESRFVVGRKQSIHPSVARSNCSGSVTAYFEDSTLLDKFINETESSIEFEMPDGAGNKYVFKLPRIKYGSGQPDVEGEGPIMLTMSFQALLDPVTGTNIQIDRVPV